MNKILQRSNLKLEKTLIFSLLFIFLWLILKPFLISFTLCYLLLPLINPTEKLLKSRALSILLVFFLVFCTVMVICTIFVPLFIKEISNILNKVYPNWRQSFDLLHNLSLHSDLLKDMGNFKSINSIEDLCNKYLNTLLNIGPRLVNYCINSGIALLSFLSTMVLIPFITFYLMQDWYNLLNILQKHIHNRAVITLTQLINCKIKLYLKGQFCIASLISAYYLSCFYCIGLQNFFSLAFLCGFFTFIPYLGALISFLFVFTIALSELGTLPCLYLLFSFIFAQILEANFLAPHFIAGKIGLHPLWVLFCMLVSSSLFGFNGVLLAIPLSIIIGFTLNYHLQKNML